MHPAGRPGRTSKGNAAANTLSGLGGSDKLAGGSSNDTLAGGAGNDIFVFDKALNANKDTITDFANATGNDDTVWLENAIFTRLAAAGALKADVFWVGATAHDANGDIVYNQATGALFYDADGKGAGSAIQFATLANKPVLAADDFMVI